MAPHPRMTWIYGRAAPAATPALVGADRWSALRLSGHPRMARIYCRPRSASTVTHARVPPAAGCSPAPGGAVSVVLTADGRSLPSVPSWLGPPPFPGGWPDAAARCAASGNACRPGWGHHRSLAAGPMLQPDALHRAMRADQGRHLPGRAMPIGAACLRRGLPAGTGRRCWRRSRCWRSCRAPAAQCCWCRCRSRESAR